MATAPRRTRNSAGAGGGSPKFPLRFQYQVQRVTGVEVETWTVVASKKSGRLTTEVAQQRPGSPVRPIPSPGEGGHTIAFSVDGTVTTSYGLSLEQCVADLRHAYRGDPDDAIEDFFDAIQRAAARRK